MYLSDDLAFRLLSAVWSVAYCNSPNDMVCCTMRGRHAKCSRPGSYSSSSAFADSWEKYSTNCSVEWHLMICIHT